MNIKQLFKKIDQANEVASMARQGDSYCVCVEIDHCYQYNLEDRNNSIWFGDMDHLQKAFKKDWFPDFVNHLLKAELTERANCRGVFDATVLGCSVEVTLAYRRMN